MKYIATLAVLMMLTVPAVAGKSGPVMAKATPDQRALAQVIAGRIQGALDAEPFAAKDCKGSDCTASAAH